MFTKKVKLFVILGLLVSVQMPLYAASVGKIEGYIIDSQTADPLPGANVYLEGTSFGSATDLNGKYVIINVPAGSYKLVVNYVGYQEKTVDITVEEGETLTENVTVEFQAIEGETIVVTAQAEAQMQAINQQLASNTIANVVSKSRIQEMPDVNAAESIGRLPGIAINRTGGEATTISIRGLSPKYNTVTINGVRVPATGADDRSVDLSLISSNILDGIEVKKAITPDMDADVLGGTVDLRLKSAQEGLMVNAQAQVGYSKLQDYFGNYNGTANVSNRFLDGDLGVIVGINLDNYDRSADKYDGTYRQAGSGIDTKNIIENVTVREETVERGRRGGSIVLDYKLPNGQILANSFYNELKWDGLYRINRMNVNDNRHYYEMEERNGTTSIFSGALGVEQDYDWLKIDGNVSWASTRSSSPDERIYQFIQEYGAFSPPAPIDEKTKPTEVADFAVIDTFETGLAEVWVEDTERKENDSSIELNFQMPLSFSRSISGFVKVGGKFRYLDRMNDVERRGRNGIQYGNGSGPNNILTTLDAAVPEWGVDSLVTEHGILPISIFLDDYSRTRVVNGDYPLGFTYSRDMMNTVVQVLSNGGDFRRMSIESLGNDYNGLERYYAGYLMAEFNFGQDISATAGVRYEKDYSEYDGWRFREVSLNNEQGPPADLAHIHNVRQNEFWLPMVHFRWQATEWMKIWLARTESLTRPDFIQYAPITRINSYQSYMRAANSLLKPSHSVNYDAAVSFFEKYVGLFSVAGFYKDISDLIFQTRYNFRLGIPVPEGFNIPQSWLTGASPSADLYINNPFKSIVKGFELEWQTHFWYLPSFLRGLVLNVNYTRIFSEMEKRLYFTRQGELIQIRPPVYAYEVVDSSRTTRLPDQPAHLANITLGYDYKGFSVRLSWLYQTDKLSFIQQNPVRDEFSGEYNRWDLTFKQKIGEQWEVYVNFANLANRPDENFQGYAFDKPTYTEYYGFTWDIGARFKL